MLFCTALDIIIQKIFSNWVNILLLYLYLQEQLRSQEKKIADQQAVIMTFIEKEKILREETEKKQAEEIEKDRRERLEQQETLKKDLNESFDAKVPFHFYH